MPAWATDTTAWIGSHREPLILAAGVLTVLFLAWGVRRAARHTTSDRIVDGVALALTLGWSAEGMWEVAQQTLKLPPLVAAPGLFVFTSLMVAAMLRASRHQAVHGHPGRHGRFAWTVAVAEACVVSLAGDTAPEAALRIAIPLLAVYQWWLGLVGDGTTEDLGATSWRWTPRRLLLAVGAIEPGERDAETVDRDGLVTRMTRVEYRRRHAGKRAAQRYGRQLARLSLKADDDVIAEVRRRVDRATWWQTPAELTAEVQAVADRAIADLRGGWRDRVKARLRRAPEGSEPPRTAPSAHPAQPVAHLDVPAIILPPRTAPAAHRAAAQPAPRTNGHPVAQAVAHPGGAAPRTAQDQPAQASRTTAQPRDVRAPRTARSSTTSDDTVREAVTAHRAAHPRDDDRATARAVKTAHPDASARALSRALGCSDSTVRAYLKEES